MNQITTWIKSHPKESVAGLIVGIALLWYLLRSGGGSSSATTPVGVNGSGLSGSQYLQLAALNQQGFAAQNQNNVQLVQLADQTAVQQAQIADSFQLGEDQNTSQEASTQSLIAAQLEANQQNNALAGAALGDQYNLGEDTLTAQTQIALQNATTQQEALSIQQQAQEAANQFALASVSANKSGRTASGVASIVGSLENPAVAPGVVAANQPYEVASNFQTSSVLSSIGNLLKGGSSILGGLFGGNLGSSGSSNSPYYPVYPQPSSPYEEGYYV
jgi:hypothetical protein